MTFQLAVRLKHLRDNGKKIISQAKYEKWVDDNIKDLYKDLSCSQSFSHTRRMSRDIDALLSQTNSANRHKHFKDKVMDFIEK